VNFNKLFESTKIGRVTIKNRIAMSPMLPLGLYRDGVMSERMIEYYIERAKGGVGLVITGVFKVENEVEPAPVPYYPIVNLKGLGPLSELSDYVHAYGAKLFVQLTAGAGRLIPPEMIDVFGFKPVSASVNPAFYRPNVSTRALTTEETEQLGKSFKRAAELLASAEVDGVELHGHQGYLLDQFTTALWNRRTDKYGGDLEGRLRLPIEVLEAVKEGAGKDFPVTYRYGLKHFLKTPEQGSLSQGGYVERGRDIEEGLEMGKSLEKAGFDGLHVDAGCYESQYWPHPPIYQPHGCSLDLIALVKKVVSIPIIAVGKLDIPDLAEKVLEENKADIIAIGRGLLADPDWPRKIREGRLEDIRPCIGCHEGCMMRSQSESMGRPFTCSVNPSCAKEKELRITRAEKSRRILVVGGGVAGMECARVAALRGHHVTILEKSARLGGHLIEACVPEFKSDLRRLLGWYETQLKELSIDLKLNSEATPESIKKGGWDAVAIATGSAYRVPDITGIRHDTVTTCGDLLSGKRDAGKTVVVIGGGSEGCETAAWLANLGKKVTVAEMLPGLATDLWESNRMMLHEMLHQSGVTTLVNTYVEEVTDDGVITIDKNFQKNTIKADTIALATGLRPRREIYDALANDVKELYLIGDCRQPHKIHHAIWDGFITGFSI
jgi:2-enoate reductase